MNDIQETATIPTDILLLQLSKYGKPRVSLTDSGWFATVDMAIAAKGASFSIDSGFEAPHTATPNAALSECYRRVLGAINGLQGVGL